MKKRIISLLLITAMAVTMVSGCGQKENTQKADSSNTVSGDTGKTDTSKEDAGSSKLPQVELTILTGADQVDQPDAEKVSDAILEATKDTINVKINVQSYAWGDYKSKVDTMLAAGQNIDIYLDFYGEYKKDADKKQIIPLDDLLEKYGPALKENIPDIWYQDLKYNGELYGIPAVYPSVGQDCITIREDLLKKYNLPDIDMNDISTVEAYLDAVVKNEPNMVGMTGREGRVNNLNTIFRQYGKSNSEVAVVGNDYGNIVSVDGSQKPYKVYSAFETEGTKEDIAWMQKAQAHGWIASNALTEKDPNAVFMSGKSALMPFDMWTINSLAPTMEKNISGCKIESVAQYDYSKPLLKTGKTNNFAVISSTSKNPERAMMFLNWISESQDNYDLLMYGIKGTDWNPVGDTQYELPEGVDQANLPYNPSPWWFKNQKYDRMLTTAHPAFLNIYNKAKDAQIETLDITDFSFNQEPVKIELNQIQTVMLEKWQPVALGILSSEEDYNKAVKALYDAGLQKVLDEAQKQLDEWAAARN